LCSRFTSIERQASTVSRPERLGRPDPKPPHHAPPFFPKSSGKLAGAAIPIAASAATASAFRPAYQVGQQRESNLTWPVLSTP
jgi:hypothetical protein